jgi:type III restriction enzyme
VKFDLFDYQETAAAEIIDAFDEGFSRYKKNGKLTVVSLAAPTAAGKTVIATSVVEQLLFGSDAVEPRPEMTFLWVTDDPSLNQQTIGKMLQASSLIEPGQLVTVDQSLNQPVLDRGKVYFVHIQQLGKGATTFVKRSDKRQYPIWDIIGKTITSRGDNFALIIDEAHRGTSSRSGNKSIAAQLIDGNGGQMPPTPVVLGITATPDRFLDAINKGGRTHQPVEVDPEAVRLSGLIKDIIRIRHPEEDEPGDSTLLGLAVKDLQEYDKAWATYAMEQQEPRVQPVLVVQVQAGASTAELATIAATLANEWNILDGKAIGHSFEEHSTLNLGTRSVRYIAPQDIQDDPHLRVVLFKEALTTGWDCPRAEVMFSFRKAVDYTYIAQLIGRMVRTPLARSITTNEFLNTVALYLPHYNAVNVATVVKGLTDDGAGFTPRIEIDSVNCARNPSVPSKVWDRLAQLPSYTRPGKHHRNDVARLVSLAMQLVKNNIYKEANEAARNHIVGTLATEAKRTEAYLKLQVADYSQLDFQTQNVNLGTGETTTVKESIALNARNIDDLFHRTRRTFGDAAGNWYWDAICSADENLDPDAAKIMVAALAADPSVPLALQAACKQLIDTWRRKYGKDIEVLPDAKLSAFYRIWQTARKPEQISLMMPSLISAADKVLKKVDGELTLVSVARYDKHIYSNGKNKFPANLNTWEADVVKAELSKPTLVGWYKNPTGGAHAVCVPYEESKVAKSLFPDFLFFHKVDGEIVVDLVDPHWPNAGDTGPKWAGLADYATRHGAVFRRISAVVKNVDGSLQSIDLRNTDVADRLKEAANEVDILRIFADLGNAY